MAELRARFSMIDEMSEKLSRIANVGQQMISQWESTNNSMNTSMENAASYASNAVTALNGVSNAMDGVNSSSSYAVSGANAFLESVNNLGNSVNITSQAAEQLAEVSSRTSDTLSAENEIFSQCEQAVGQLNSEIENAVNVNSELTGSFTQANQAMNEYINSGKMSVEAQSELENASKTAEKALTYLSDAQYNAKKATEYYNAVIQSGTEDARAYEMAQSRLKQTLKNLTSAEDNASKAVKEYEDAMRSAGDESEDFGEKSKKPISALESLLTGTGIVIGLKKIADGFMECSDSAAQFESSIAKVSTIADTSVTSLDTISSDIMKLSQESGQLVTGLTEATYQAISASVDTASAVKFVDEANKLAASGFTQQATAADILTTAINAYGLAVSDATEISDMLITTQNLGKTTVDELSQNMGRVIPLAAAYNVEMDNLSTAYAELTKNGIATAESTTYIKSMLNELGSTGSDVSKILLEETGQSFASLMKNGYSLADVLSIVGNSVNDDATAFNNLWSSQEAGIGALALFNAGASAFNSTLDKMRDSSGATSKAYETMTSTTAHANERMQNAFSNLGITIGTQLNPVMSHLYNQVADITDEIRNFAEEHPKTVAAVSGTVTALGLAVGMVTAYTAVTKAAQVATKAFNLTLSASQVGLIIGGIAAAGAAIGTLAHAFSSAKDDIEDYNGTLKQCRTEIETTQDTLDNLRGKYDENSSAVKTLESELNLLKSQYEQAGGYMQELYEKSMQTADSMNTLSDTAREQNTSIDNMEVAGLKAVTMLERLSGKSEITNTDLSLMSEYANYLNDTFNCNIQVNYDTGDISGMESIYKVIEEMTNQKKVQVSLDYISNPEVVSGFIDQNDAIIRTQGELDTLMNKYGEAGVEAYNFYRSQKEAGKNYEDNRLDYTKFREGMGLPEWDYGKYMSGFFNDIDEAQAKLSEMENKFDETKNEVQTHCEVLGISYDEMVDTWLSGNEDIENSTDNLAQEAANGFDSAKGIMEEYTDQILKLATSYDEAYNSALESMQGQFGLFDEASMKVDAYTKSTVDNAQAALKSQLDYWESYGANIDYMKNVTAADLGVTQQQYDAFMEHVRTGTPEAAGLLNDMVGKVKEGNTEAVTNVIQTQGKITELQDGIATDIGKWASGIDEEMQKVYDEMKAKINDLDLSVEAKKSASNTMSSYIASISAAKSTAVVEAQSVVEAVKSVFQNANLSFTAGGVSGSVSDSVSAPGYATGNLSADDKQAAGGIAKGGLTLVGEQGPELIWLNGGERVYNNNDTNRIISAITGTRGTNYMSSNSYYTSESSSNYSTVINNYGDPETKVDFSLLDALLPKLRSGDEIRNYSENVSYGDTYAPDNSRSYSTEYGDTVSNYDNSIIDYGDTIKNISDNSYNPDYSRQSEISTDYGDTIRNITDSISSTDNSAIYENSEYSEIANAYDSIYNNDYSRNISGGNTLANDAISLYSTFNSNEHNNNYSYSNIPQNGAQDAYNSASFVSPGANNNGCDNSIENYINNSYENHIMSGNDSLSYGDGIISVIMPFLYKNPIENETVVNEVHRASESLYIPDKDNSVVAAGEISPNTAERSGGETSEIVSKKEVDLNINGSGKITVNSKADKDEIISILLEYMKPVISEIVEQEAFEEGESYYDF